MSLRKIHPIETRITITLSGDKVQIPDTLRQTVELHWEEQAKLNPRLRNGEVFTITSVNEDGHDMHITLAETDYAHYVYSERVGGMGEHAVHIIHSATLVVTADNKLVVGEMADDTAKPGVILCCGGGIDHNDVKDGVVDLGYSATHELAEELGIDANDKTKVKSFAPKYLNSGGPKDKMTLIYVLELNQTSEQFMEDYASLLKQLQNRNEAPEFKQIFCVNNNTEAVEHFIHKYQSKLAEYIPELFRKAANI